MTETLYLSKPAIISAIGEGLKQHIEMLLNGEASPLVHSDKVFSEQQISGKMGVFPRLLKPLIQKKLDQQKKYFAEPSGEK